MTGPTHDARRGKQRTNTAAATEAVRRMAAERAVDDPVKLDRAVRIVKIALQRGQITLDDLGKANA